MADTENLSFKKCTVQDLKKLLQENDLPTTGIKNDLIERLQKEAPQVYRQLLQECNTNTKYAERKLDLARRERDLLQRELELKRREDELRDHASIPDARSPTISKSTDYNIKELKEFISNFNGTGNEYFRWRQEIEFLRDAYGLDDSDTKMLIYSKLEGEALRWFSSKPEHRSLAATDLLDRLKHMFDQRPNELTLRRDFEERVWRTGESFSDYCHEKIILAKQIPIDNDKIKECIIKGVPDPQLQAILQKFKEISEMLKFENITLRNDPKERNLYGEKQQKTVEEGKIVSIEQTAVDPTQKKIIKCFNCKERGHRASEYKNPGATVENSTEQRPHCSKENLSMPATAANLIQLGFETGSCMISLSYTAPQEDTGSAARAAVMVEAQTVSRQHLVSVVSGAHIVHLNKIKELFYRILTIKFEYSRKCFRSPFS